MALIVAINVKLGAITSSFLLTSQAKRPKCVDVPLFVATAYLDFNNTDNFFSKIFTCGPEVDAQPFDKD